MRPSSRPRGGGRGAAIDLAIEAHNMVDWYRRIQEDCANTIQALVVKYPRGHRPDDIKARLHQLELAQARAFVLIERHRKQAERYERYAGIGPSATAIGVPA